MQCTAKLTAIKTDNFQMSLSDFKKPKINSMNIIMYKT